MRRGPLIPTIALGAGIAVSGAVHASWWVGLIPVLAALGIYLVIIRVSKDPVAAFRIGKWHILWAVMLFAGVGIADESLSRPLTLEEAFGTPIPDTLFGTVTGVLTKTYGERIDIVIDGTNGAKARIRTGATELSPGDVISFPSRFLTDASADTTAIGRRLYPALIASGILYTGRMVPKHILYEGRSSGPRYFFTGIREGIEKAIQRSHLSRRTAAFLNAILMGDKTGLDEDTRLTFANGGMAHMLALSGLHIGILAGFLLLLVWPLKLLGHYKSGYAVAIIFLWLYVAVTGMAYSSVRACLMTSFAFIGIMTERKNFAVDALCSACILILIFDPAALFDAGFQLSVVCVGALIAFAPRLNPIGHRKHPVLFYISGAIITTIAATAASWVLISYYFSQIPLMFLPANLLLLPLLPTYLSLAVVFTAGLCMGVEIGWLGYLLDAGYRFLLKSVEILSGGTEFVIECQVPLWGVAIWLSLLSIAAWYLNRKEMK